MNKKLLISMKKEKEYQSPSLKVVEIESLQILAGSNGSGTEKYGVNPNSLDDDDFE